MKKLICLGLSVIVAFSLLTGCKSSKESTNQTTTTASTTTKKYDEIDTTIKSFFKAFEKGDFDKMKEFCTENGKTQFNKYGYLGMNKAALNYLDNKYRESEKTGKVGVCFRLKVIECNDVQKGIYKKGDTIGYCAIMKKEDNNKWLIDSITTDLSAIND